MVCLWMCHRISVPHGFQHHIDPYGCVAEDAQRVVTVRHCEGGYTSLVRADQPLRLEVPNLVMEGHCTENRPCHWVSTLELGLWLEV